MDLNFIAMPNEETELNLIDEYFCSPNLAEPIMLNDEYSTIEIVATKGFKIINTDKSFSYILGSFLSETHLIKRGLRSYLGDALFQMINTNKNWYNIAQKEMFSKFPQLAKVKKSKNMMKFYINFIEEYFDMKERGFN